MRAAFLGLGIMGSRMSRRLLDAGFGLTVWNRTPGRAKDLVQSGAREARAPSEAARDADVVLTMLGDPASVREVILGPNGVLEGLPSGSILIDLTTVDPETPRELEKAAAEKGAFFLEAPVTGSRPAASSGELVLMVGGEAEVLSRAEPVLKPLSRRIVHMGPVGAGARMKLLNNLIIAVSMQALYEGMTLGRQGGLRDEAMLEVLLSSASASPLLKMKGTAVQNRNFETNFSVKHMAKDLFLAVEEAHRRNVPLPLLMTVHALYESALARGLGEEDIAALVKITEQMSGLNPSV
jgi:3-hydroxyisobutyrate dehydrogenase